MPSQFTVKSTVSLSSWKYVINIRQADDLLKESSQSIIHTKMVLLLPEHYLDNDSSRKLPFLFQIFLFSPSLSPKERAKALEHTCTCNLHLPTHSFHLSSVSSIVITACSMGPPISLAPFLHYIPSWKPLSCWHTPAPGLAPSL